MALDQAYLAKIHDAKLVFPEALRGELRQRRALLQHGTAQYDFGFLNHSDGNGAGVIYSDPGRRPRLADLLATSE